MMVIIIWKKLNPEMISYNGGFCLLNRKRQTEYTYFS